MNDFDIPALQEVQRITEEVLRRPEFHRLNERAAGEPGWLARLFDWLGAFRLFELGAFGTVIVKVLLIILLAALVVYLVRILLGRYGELKHARAAGPLQASTGREMSGDEPDATLQTAERALGTGDIRSAISILHRELIRLLSERGLVDRKKWKTSLIYLRECPKDTAQYPLLRELTLAFNTIVYGHFDYDRGEIARFLSELRSLDGRE